jgi:hypothetical protein
MYRTLLLVLIFAEFIHANIGIVTDFKGNASILRRDIKIPIRVGTKIEQYDFIKTNISSNVVIKFIDKTLFTLNQESTLEIVDYVYNEKIHDKNILKFNILKGSFKSISGRISKLNRTKFKLKTTTALIGVKGTTIVADQKTVGTIDGVVEILSQGVTLEVPKGKMVQTYLNIPPSPLRGLKLEQFGKLNLSIESIKQNNKSKQKNKRKKVSELSKKLRKKIRVKSEKVKNTNSSNLNIKIQKTFKATNTKTKQVESTNTTNINIEKHLNNIVNKEIKRILIQKEKRKNKEIKRILIQKEIANQISLNTNLINKHILLSKNEMSLKIYSYNNTNNFTEYTYDSMNHPISKRGTWSQEENSGKIILHYADSSYAKINVNNMLSDKSNVDYELFDAYGNKLFKLNNNKIVSINTIKYARNITTSDIVRETDTVHRVGKANSINLKTNYINRSGYGSNNSYSSTSGDRHHFHFNIDGETICHHGNYNYTIDRFLENKSKNEFESNLNQFSGEGKSKVYALGGLEYVQWGIWEKYNNLSNEIEKIGFWHTGNNNNIIIPNQGTATYSGSAIGMLIKDNTIVGALNGNINLKLNFATDKISGSMKLYHNNILWSDSIITQASISNKSVTTLSGNNISSGNIDYNYYGKKDGNIQNISGNFDITKQNKEIGIGVYGANKD